MDDQNKNLIVALALSAIVYLGWMFFFAPDAPVAPVVPVSEQTAGAGDTGIPTPLLNSAPLVTATPAETLQTALAKTERLTVDTDRLTGSISLTGGRIDDIALKDYNETLDADSELVTLLRPAGSDSAYYSVFGWAPGGDLAAADVPGSATAWQIESGDVLTTDKPVTLIWDNGKGLTFRRQIEVDENYLFTVTQSVENTGATAARMAPYGLVARQGTPDTLNFFVLHEGVVRQSDDELSEIKYKELPDMDPLANQARLGEEASVQENGWIGFTDKNWMTALIPASGQAFTSTTGYYTGSDIYFVETRNPVVSVEPGQSVEVETRMFAGAKEWAAIRSYEDDNGIINFLDSIDWGMFFFLTKPIFAMLHWLNSVIGNMGWSIIALTLVIKALLFPLAYKSYVSMARMKELQPEMEKLKEKAGDDRAKLQKEMMTLYKKNKVNPASGCLPLLLQIPIFFSLYKVIFVTIELRQAPWLGWIYDLSAPDPSSILNLFGLLSISLPADDSLFAILSLGILPILLGISMFLQQKLNPAPTDASQAMIMAWMPWVFMFMLGQFASGLVLYWIANNTITFTQQYLIMRSHGHKPDVFGNIIRTFKRKKTES
ncbi:membrane protein insertase YidC [Candidatus Halocynthiibacter alkanivorans]|uniref:membrane protein insertase YidC n=1 Tax=Candidatus Halocynthiibacter alkanivorans TaxID=2267619 RepID=UPI000DF3CE09|nr:membrane protein insertase YidC [Candidatus Halocynthiibacter alkanivorans]